MYLIKLKILLISSLLLSACSVSTTTPVAVAQETIRIDPENPRPIITKPVEFVVITEENRSKLDSNPVWYTMTTDSYENLAYNMQEIIRYISQQQTQINYYKSITSN